MKRYLKQADLRSEESKRERSELFQKTQGPYWAYHRKLLERLSSDYNRTTHESDVFARLGARYFASGYSVIGLIEMAMRLALMDPKQPLKILDFGGGYGRVSRFLVMAFPNARIYHCDFEKKASDFCATQFGVESFQTPQSIIELTADVFPTQFDIIWLGSIFTHTRWEDTIRTLEVFSQIQDEAGAVVFTTAGEYVAERLAMGELGGLDIEGAEELLRQFHETGYGYSRYAKWDESIPWGRTLLSPSKHLQLYEEIADKYRLLSFMPRGMIGRQDVSIVQQFPAS